MANKGASALLLLAIVLKTTNTLGNLVEGKAKPVQYIILPPGHYVKDQYNVIHNTSNCTASTVATDRNDDVTVLACLYGELLLNGVTQANLDDGVTNSDIRTFYTWERDSIPINRAFVTLQFPNNTITPTKVVVYCLEMMQLQATEPGRIRLHSSTTESIYPVENEIDLNNNDIVTEDVKCGRTSGNDNYKYIRYNITIPQEIRVPLNYLRIEFELGGMVDWIFISEVEVYHLFEPLPNSTSVQVPTSSIMTSSSADPLSIIVSTTTTTETSSIEIKGVTSSSSMSTKPVLSTSSTTSTLSTVYSLLTTSSTPTNSFHTPVFVFPTINPFVLHLKTARLNVTINCTVTWEGDLSQLTTMWSHNGTTINNSQKYLIAEDHLFIRQFILEDIGTYECTVKHSSGWNDSRQYIISVKDGDLVKQPGRGDSSSEDIPLPVFIGAAAGSALLLLLCLTLTVCAIMCHRKNKREKRTRKKSYLVSEESPPFLHTYANENSLERCKISMDSRYENVNITDSLTTEICNKEIKSNPPTVPRFPRKFKYSKRLPPPELPKLQGNYAFLGNYKKLKAIPSLLVSDQISETYFDIYDDAVNAALKPIPQSPQDIYCEAFDYNHHDKEEDNDIYNGLSMCVPIYDNPGPLAETEAPEFVEWSNIRVVTKIGEGQFGDVYLAETSDNVEQGNTESKSFAAIKTLKGDYSLYMKQQFEKEIKFMSRLNNANVVRLLGICNKGMPFIMMEYMGNGDLHMFLKKHYLSETGQDIAEAVILIDTVILQYMALQIANGMRYLASFGFIHRDLAARNCLVGEEYIVKIADFGMTQDLYNESYFVMQGKAIVPIRWMAPECFFGKFSTKTDVWSYGVTLWEIFTLCRKQPYHEMTDEQLIIDVQKGRNRTLLKRPRSIPDEVYYAMADCWLYDSKKRPDFELVYDQLFDVYAKYNQQ